MAFDPAVRAWRNDFTREVGGPPQIEGGDYDYRKAFVAGDGPRAVAGDTIPHWGSSGKAGNHPTAWKQAFVAKYGVDPDEQSQAGFTPDQSAMVNDQLRSDMRTQDIRRLVGR